MKQVIKHLLGMHFKQYTACLAISNIICNIIYILKKMKRQPYNNIRRSEKIRENQCFFEADGLQKKIRKFNANKAQGPIDAQVKMREIQCFWKEGWEYNHTHHIFLEPKVTRPQFYLKHGSNNERLESYYALLARFVSKLKAENEDETNFKIDCIQFEPEPSIGPTEAEMEVQLQGLIEFTRDSKDEDVARMSLAHFIKTIQHICERMGNSFHSSLQASLENMMDEVLQEGQIQHLRVISQTCTHLLQGQEPMEEAQHETLEFAIRFVFELFNISDASEIILAFFDRHSCLYYTSHNYSQANQQFGSFYDSSCLLGQFAAHSWHGCLGLEIVYCLNASKLRLLNQIKINSFCSTVSHFLKQDACAWTQKIFGSKYALSR